MARFKAQSNTDSYDEQKTREVVAGFNWFEKALERSKYRKDVAERFHDYIKPGAAGAGAGSSLDSIVDQSSKRYYAPTFEKPNGLLRTVQEDAAELAEGGVPKSGFSLGTPASNIKDMKGLKYNGALGPGLNLLARAMGDNHAIKLLNKKHILKHNVLEVVVHLSPLDPKTGVPIPNAKPIVHSFDLADYDMQPPDVQKASPSYVQQWANDGMSAQDILNLNDAIASGKTMPLHAKTDASAYMNGVVAPAADALKGEALKVGSINAIQRAFVVGGIVAAGLGLAANAGLGIHSATHMQDPPGFEQKIDPSHNPYLVNPTTGDDPSSAFPQTSNSSGTSPMGGTVFQQGTTPFGSVSQNFGNLSSALGTAPSVAQMPQGSGVGFMPSVNTDKQENGQPNYNADQNPFDWTRISAAALSVRMANDGAAIPMSPQQSASVSMPEVFNSVLKGLPSEEELEKMITDAVATGDTPEGFHQLAQVLNSITNIAAPHVEIFENSMGSAQSATSAPNRVAGRGFEAVKGVPGFSTLDNSIQDTSAFMNPYLEQYQAIKNRAQYDPAFAQWLKDNPDYASGIDPNHRGYYGQGAETAQMMRQQDPNENPDQELERDLNMMNGGNWQQWEAPQTAVQQQSSNYYRNLGMTDANGNNIGEGLAQANSMPAVGAGQAPEYNAQPSQYQQINPNGGGYTSGYKNWTQGQPASYNNTPPAWKWMAGPNGGTWVPNN